MMKFILASANPHKAIELNQLLASPGIEIISAPEKLDVLENGASFQENALIKAKAYAKHFKMPAVSDDSGLVVNALPDLLGVHSARFAPELTDYQDKCKKLIELLAHHDDRTAYFVCYLCFYFSEDQIFHFEGRLKGEIAHELSGQAGFGYDPIFIPEPHLAERKTLASLPEWKAAHSHRAKACLAAKQFLSEKQLPRLIK